MTLAMKGKLVTQRVWQVLDPGPSAVTGWTATADDGSKITHLHARTDGPERVTSYRYQSPLCQFDFRLLERGNPNVINPAEVVFIFDGALLALASSVPANRLAQIRADVIDGVTVLNRTLSSGRRDFALSRVVVQN
ncbi:hypothetical protein [Terricaulis silvestris]|uniref:Uncharacterized protein n=1 Tax=Terricaulis silvestris TaxID=2686094 RepID=A0A6I6MY81_9CAUL|nr:hypothetical protein [Terricaulis silvestris]QGZ96602.1 hypothetical protein DSM104635_03462 [Terricaulis silvestris]